MTDEDCVDDLVFITNTPTEAKSLLLSLEQQYVRALYVNANRTKSKKQPFLAMARLKN